jgi:DNA-binding GntR family transcriptional regulator
MIHQTIELRTARQLTRDHVRAMIIDGQLSSDTRLEEVKLSKLIGISRTPLREALITLEEEGLVRSTPHKGFVVVKPNEEFVRESYPILAALEAMAVRTSGQALRDGVPRLRALNAALVEETEKPGQYGLDRAFHAALTEHCGNERLLMLLGRERARVQLVDGSHRRGMADLAGSVAKHAAIVDAIERGRSEDAVELLLGHWREGMEVVSRWLREAQ